MKRNLPFPSGCQKEVLELLTSSQILFVLGNDTSVTFHKLSSLLDLSQGKRVDDRGTTVDMKTKRLHTS